MERIIDESELDTCLARITHILDARSPAEYGDDHIPGAINIPVLSNEQREEVDKAPGARFDQRQQLRQAGIRLPFEPARNAVAILADALRDRADGCITPEGLQELPDFFLGCQGDGRWLAPGASRKPT